VQSQYNDLTHWFATALPVTKVEAHWFDTALAIIFGRVFAPNQVRPEDREITTSCATD